jgi:hypothetical protein
MKRKQVVLVFIALILLLSSSMIWLSNQKSGKEIDYCLSYKGESSLWAAEYMVWENKTASTQLGFDILKQMKLTGPGGKYISKLKITYKGKLADIVRSKSISCSYGISNSKSTCIMGLPLPGNQKTFEFNTSSDDSDMKESRDTMVVTVNLDQKADTVHMESLKKKQ